MYDMAGKVRVYLSAIDRASCNAAETGFVYLIDWRAGNVQTVKKIATKDASLYKFWNPRGGNRGARGLAFFDNKLYVATATSIKVYDEWLNLLDEIRHPYLAGLHSIHVGKMGILVAVTVHDMVMRIDFSGKEQFIWRGSESRKLQEALGFDARPDIRSIDDIDEEYLRSNRLHLSGLVVKNEYIYALSGKLGVLIKLNPDKPDSEKLAIARYQSHLNHPHDVYVSANNTFLINNTKQQEIQEYNSNGYLLRTIKTPVYPVSQVSMFATPGWQRGLAWLGGSTYLVGTSPLTIFSVNIESGKIIDVLKLSESLTLASYGICVVQ